MSWLTFAYSFFAVIIGFFAGYYFVVAILLRKQVIDLLKKLETAYEITNFLSGLEELDNESSDSED